MRSKFWFESGMCALVTLLNGALPSGAMADAVSPVPMPEVYGRLPLSFEANQGQVDRSVRFLSRGLGYTLFLTSTEAVLRLSRQGQETSIVGVRLAGGNGHPHVIGVGPQTATSNYFIGNDPRGWHTGVAHYAEVLMQSVYPGVDMVYRGDQQRLEYDFVVAPGADPGRIRLAFRGADRITIGARGELILHTASGDLVQPPPTVYQKDGQRRRQIEGRYVLLPGRQVGFSLGRYDRTRPLIIDPVLVYSSFLGGSGDEVINGIAVDAAGNAYLTGSTDSLTFPGITGSSIRPTNGGGVRDAFVTKINAAGTAIVYSTFLGGSGEDRAIGIAVDGSGNAYVTGFTSSTTFPGVSSGSIQKTNAGSNDAFVTKVNATGTALVYSTFLGGSKGDGGVHIAIDGTGNSYVLGTTSSPAFPGVNAGSIQPVLNEGFIAGDFFITKINAAGTAIVYSTYLGGESGFEFAGGIAVDGAGNAYVTGFTASKSFPGVNGASLQPAHGGGSYDAFLTKINAPGTAIVYSTFLGGSEEDFAEALAVDGSGNAYVVGQTGSLSFPGVNVASLQPANAGGIGDAFVTKVNAAGTAIVYSTFLGGSGHDQATGVAIDGAGSAHVAGWTDSTTFPGIDESSLQPVNAGSFDAFVTQINAAGTATVYSTFLGGGGSDVANGIALDGAGNAYVAGSTSSATFPGVSGSALQPVNAGGTHDAFVAKVGAATSPGPCDATDTTLCLNGSRFRVTAHFDAGGGNAGTAHVVQLTPDTGYLWFFGSSNVEVVVKVLNGCGLGGHYWVFAGGLTDVNVVMTVTDTATGAVKTYTNPAHTKFQPIQDTSAFATCSAQASASPAAIEDRVVKEAEAMHGLVADKATTCTAGSTVLCLNENRFKVTATFDAGGGNSGTAHTVQLTPDTGYLWFFGSSNVEVVVKVLNGCGLGGHYWVFAGGLTDVKVVMTVTDTATGAVKTYTNPAHTKFQPIQDTSAFATCSSGPAGAPYGVDSHTVALWHFEDLSSGIVADATGLNPGLASGSTVVPSLFGHGLGFRGDGDGDYVIVPDSPSLRGMAQMTIEAWIHPTNFVLPLFNGAETIVGRGDATPPYNLYQITLLRNGDSPSFNYFSVAMEVLASGRDSQAESTVHHPPNQWYYVVGTYDGDKARVYVNGVLEAVGNSSPGIVVTTTDPLFINNHTFFSQTASSNGMIGGIFDEVRISNTARSASEIAAIYHAAVP
jgi:concanavalin A-like lectin/glucanase superfamily protein/beta-propeller repeat-containing protein